MNDHILKNNVFVELSFAKTFQLMDQLLAKEFTVKNLGVSHRSINHWDREGLFIKQNLDQKWRKYNFVEYIWIKIVKNFREFGLSFDIIRKVKEQLVEKIPLQEFFELLKSDEIRSKIEPSQYYKDELKEMYDEITNLSSEQIKEMHSSDVEDNPFCLLMILITGFISIRGKASLLINVDGEICIFFENISEADKEREDYLKEFLDDSHLSISLNKILEEFIKSMDEEKTFHPLYLITKEEKEVIELIREKSLIELKIKFNNDYEIELLESKKRQSIDPEARFLDVIISGGYQDVRFQTQNGKIVEFTNTRKIKLK